MAQLIYLEPSAEGGSPWKHSAPEANGPAAATRPAFPKPHLKTRTRPGLRSFSAPAILFLIGLSAPWLLSHWQGSGPLAATASELAGRAAVIDGDTVEIRGERIRLHGIDAPESSQICQRGSGEAYRCGQEAAWALADRIGGRNVRCELLDQDRYGRHVGRCYLDGTDLNAWMVSRGHAVAYRRYSMDYVPTEIAARARRDGAWEGYFDLPWDWRSGDRRAETVRTPAPSRTAQNTDCRIKGNISGNGRIYHLPGQRYYDRTTISQAQGERWFCSEAEAHAAGWRRALR